ncbi:MAG: YIP1 family protein [Bacteroidetes bacterium]|nr:YIP1 family protein [Bacteroidota bacterium]
MDDRQPLPSAPSLGSTISDIFVTPSEVFQSLKNTAPSHILWIVPFIVLLIINIATLTVLFTNEALKLEMRDMQSKAMEKMVEDGKLTQEQAEIAETQSESMGGIMIAFGIISAVIFLAVFFFAGALFLWLANKTILNSPVGYEKHLELYGICSWIGVLGGIITVLMMLGLGTMTATPGAGLALLGSFDPVNKWHLLIASLNIFSIWQTVAVGIGLSVFSDKKIITGIAVAFALWFIWIILSVMLGIAR